MTFFYSDDDFFSAGAAEKNLYKKKRRKLDYLRTEEKKVETKVFFYERPL